MPWQVPITVDGLEYPVTFNTEGEPSQQDYDDAVQQILSQKAQAAPAPEQETPGYLSQLGSALGLGYRQMKSGVGATFNALTGDMPDVAAEIAEMSKLQREQQALQTPEDVAFMRGLDEAEKSFDKASGPLETIGALAEYPAAVLAQPGAAFKTAIQSAPNALISGATSLAGYGLGGLVGGAAGIETGPGAILTGIAGAMAGGAVSNTLMEAGPAIFDVLNERTQGAASNMTADEITAYLQQNPDVVDEGMKTGAIRGSVIGAIEALGVKGSGRLLTMPERAAARAVQKELVAAGVDVASKEAVDQALLDPALNAATKAAAEAAKSQFSSAGNIARLAGAAAIDTGSAGVGEIAAQAAAGQDISTKEAFMEMLGDAALSLPMSVATKAVEGAQYMLNPSLVTEAGEASAANLAATGNAESAIAQDGFNQVAAKVLSPTEPAVQPVKTAEAVEAPDMSGLSDLGETEGDLVGDFGLELRGIQQEARQPAETLFELPPPQKRNLGQLRDAVIRQMDETQALVEGGDVSSLTPEYDRLLNKYRRLETLLGKIEAKMLPPSLPETGMPPVVDQEAPAGTPVQAAPLSEGAERNRAVIAEAAANLRGGGRISPGLKAAIPQQTPQKNALQVDQAGEVLQREQGETGETGSERQRMEQGQQGQEAPIEGQVQEKVITPPGEPTPATEGMVTPGDVGAHTVQKKLQKGEIKSKSAKKQAQIDVITPQKPEITIQRDATKPEQMTPEEAVRLEMALKKEVGLEKEDLDEIVAALVRVGDTKENALKDMVRLYSAGHEVTVERALTQQIPVSSAAVDAYGIKLPSGYVKQGDLYVFQPQTISDVIKGNNFPDELGQTTEFSLTSQPQTKAAEKQTPVPLREGTGAAGVVQSEPVGGSIPTVEKVSTETETTSSEKLDASEAQVVTDEKVDLTPELDRAISSSLTEEEKAFAAKELGVSGWGEEAITRFKQTLADWSVNARKVSERLANLFQKVLDASRAVLLAIGVFVGSSVNTQRGMVSTQSVKEDIPVTQIAEDLAKVERQVAASIASTPEAEAALRMSPPKAKDLIGFVDSMPSVEPVAITIPTREKGGKIDLVAEKRVPAKRANFRGVVASEDATMTADWIVLTNDNKGKPFIVGDKTNGSLFIFDKDGNLIQKTSALFGLNVGDQLPVDPWTERVTPSGRFFAKTRPSEEYGSSLRFYEPSGSDGAVAIHRVYLDEPAEKRQLRLDSKSPADNRISYGCVNVDGKIYDKKIAPTFAKGGFVYIMPETPSGRSAFKPFSLQKQSTEDKKAAAKFGRIVSEAEQKQAKEEESAAKEREKAQKAAKASLNSIIDPEKTNIVQGTVSAADAESARRALNNSGEIPNAFLTRIYASPEAFLADRANQRYFPSSYARLQSEGNIEGLFERGQTLIFADKIGVSDLDRRIGKNLGISPEQAAARRVIAHENGHRSVALFTANEKREFLGYLRRKYNDAQIDNLVRVYSEYADWRTNLESRNEALEELFLKDFERLEKIPTGGLWDDIVEFLKRVWRRITGRKGDPTLQDMKDVVRLLRNAMRRTAVPSFTLNNGGEVKLSLSDRFQGVTPAQDAEYLAAVEAGDMEKAQRMVDEAAKRAGYDGPYFHGSDEYRDIFDGGAFFTDSKSDASGYARLRSIYKSAQENDELMEIVGDVMSEEGMEDITDMSPDTLIDIAEANGFELNDANGFVFRGFLNTGNVLDISDMGASGSVRDAWDFLHEKGLIDEPWSEMDEEVKGEILDQYQGKAYYRILEGEGIFSKAFSQGYDTVKFADQDVTGKVEHDSWITKKANQFKSADPVTRDDAGNVIPLSQRFQSASPDIRFSRVEYATDYSAASSAGAQLARDTVYDDRIIEMRDAIRRAYEQSNTEAGVAMPIDELYAKAKEFAPDMTENEFGNILQDLYEDNGAVLQEGDIGSTLTEEDRRYLDLAEDEEGNQEELQAMVDEVAGKFPNMEEVSPSDFSYSDEDDGFFYHVTDKERLEQIVYDGQGLVPGMTGQFSGAAAQSNSRGKVFFTEKSGVKVWMNEVERQLENSREYDEDANVEDDIAVIRIPKNLVQNKQDDDPRNSPVKVGRDFFSTQAIPAYPPLVVRDNTGNIIPLSKRFGDAPKTSGQINVFTPEGRRAGFAVIMPKRAVASMVETEGEAVKSYQDGLEVIESNMLTAKFGGRKTKGVEPTRQTIKPNFFYKQASIQLVDDLLKDQYSIEDIANSLMSDEFLQDIGIKNNIPAIVSLTAEVKNRLSNEARSEKDLKRKVALEKLFRKLTGFDEGVGNNAGRGLGIRSYITNDPRYRWMYIYSKAEEQLRKDRELAATRVASDLPQTADNLQKTDAKAGEDAGEQVADDVEQFAESEDDTLLREGETALDSGRRSIWERMKDVLRKLALVARARKGRAANAAKASISKEERDAISQMSDAELAKMESDLLSEFDRLSEAFLKGGTEQQKATRKKMVATAKKRAEQGKSLDASKLEGDSALAEMIRAINQARPGEKAPLKKQIPWRKLLSQKASTVEIYRQRIFDAISSEESLANLDDAQKTKLADLFTQAWESKREDILDRMVDNAINQEEAAGRLTKEGADALRSQRQKLVEDINLGILDEDRLMKHLADKFGIKSEFTEAERANIDRLLDILQDDKLNEVKRNKAAYELLEALSSATKIPIAKLLADYWVSSVLSGVNTAASIAMAVMSGGYELTTGAFRILRAGFTNPKELPAEIAASFKAMAEFLKAFGREGRLAWQYLVTGDRAFLDPSMNTVLNDLNYDSIGKTVSLAEKMAKSDKIMQRVMGIWMRSVSRLLTALDSFNSGVTKAGALPIVFRQLNLDAESLKQATEKYNLQLYRDRVIQRDFNGNKPTTAHDKALVDSYAKAEMMADLQEFGKFSENADFFGQQGAMTLDPTGVGGFIYSSIKSLTGGATNRADKFLAEAEREWKQAEGGNKTAKGLQLAFAYFLQFGAYNSANLAGLRFARFAGNKFNQGLSFIPGIGMFRMYEATVKDSKIEAKDAFTDMILRNQTAGVLFAIIGAMALKAITDEPDDEKRGFFWNGGWANLTPDRKQQKLAAGQKEYTIGIPGGISFNYQNWPISPIMAAIGSLSDLARFSPEQWNEKSVIGRLGSAAASGVFSAGEIPALSGFQTLFGNNLSSKDPNEKRLDRFAKVMAGWGGGFVPRILKDIDFMTDPGLRKYESLWEQTASHIPVYRRYSGEEYYDILGKQIERKVWPGSREFMELETDPEYRTLGKLNSRGIWLTPANAGHRMVGKGRNKRKLTQEEADAYSLETGKGYRQMLLRYGSRLEQMPTERARAFLMDKADEVRDRALKKIVR